eukprot:3280171-Amphidinium_carterae.1
MSKLSSSFGDQNPPKESCRGFPTLLDCHYVCMEFWAGSGRLMLGFVWVLRWIIITSLVELHSEIAARDVQAQTRTDDGVLHLGAQASQTIEWLVEDPHSAISDKALARKMLTGAGLRPKERKELHYMSGELSSLHKVEELLRVLYPTVADIERRLGKAAPTASSSSFTRRSFAPSDASRTPAAGGSRVSAWRDRSNLSSQPKTVHVADGDLAIEPEELLDCEEEEDDQPDEEELIEEHAEEDLDSKR